MPLAKPELTAADIKSLLSKFSYRPNFEFTVVEDHKTPGDVAIHVKMTTLNARTYPANLDHVEITNYPTPIPERVLKDGEQAFWRYLHDVVITGLERHEMDEWFKVHSEPLYDPHLLAAQEERAGALIYSVVIPFMLTRNKIEDAGLPMPEGMRQTLHNIRQLLHDHHDVPWEAIDAIPGLQPVQAPA